MGPEPQHGNQPVPDPAHQGEDSRRNSSSFFAWIRSLGIRRSPQERWFAGVAGGIAHKAGIDPLIVRGIFVVLALLGGPGLLLYLAGWLLLPDHEGRIHVEELVRGRATPGVIVAVVLVGLWFLGTLIAGINIPGVRWNLWGAVGLPWWVGSTLTWLFWILVLIGVAFLIHRIALQHGRNQQQSRRGQAPDHGGHGPGEHESFSATMAGASDAVADKAKTWSAQYAEHHERRRLGAAHVLITVALALISAGGAALWADHTGAFMVGTTGANGVLIAAIAAGTAVIALSMVIAGLRGKNAGSVGFLGFVGVLTLAALAILPAGTTYHLVGENNLTEAAPASFSLVGDTNVDLGIYDAKPTLTGVDITQVAGDVNLQLPNHRPTEVTMDIAAGTIEADGLDWQRHSGVLSRRTITVNEDAPGPVLAVHVRLLAGTINISK